MTKRSVVRIALSLAMLPHIAVAQAAVASCMSAGGHTQWPTRDGSESGPEASPDSVTLERLLMGRFAILDFTTEGVNPPTLTRWTLRVEPADPPTVANLTYSRARGRLAAVAVREDDTLQFRSARRRRQASAAAARFEMRLEPATGVLRWYSLSGGNEGGAVYEVSEIDSTGFRGRWEDGGIGIAFVQRGNVHTLERLRGFYCARRIQ